MTPLQLSILLHYRGRANDFRDGDFSAPAVSDEMYWFLGEAGMLEPTLSGEPSYKLTPKGEFFVDRLCEMPLPVATFVMPSTERDK